MWMVSEVRLTVYVYTRHVAGWRRYANSNTMYSRSLIFITLITDFSLTTFLALIVPIPLLTLTKTSAFNFLPPWHRRRRQVDSVWWWAAVHLSSCPASEQYNDENARDLPMYLFCFLNIDLLFGLKKLILALSFVTTWNLKFEYCSFQPAFSGIVRVHSVCKLFGLL